MNKAKRHTLGMLESAAVLDYVRAHYANLRLTDVEFAKKASEDLGFEVINKHVGRRRVVLGIPSTTNRPSPKNTKVLFELVLELERRITALEAK
jgi:hypothetical protein